MTKLVIIQSSLNNAVKEIEKEWADNLTRQRQSLENEGTRTIQNAVRTLRVYDSGDLDRNSVMKQDRKGNAIEWSFETNGIPYAPEPRNGLGSSTKYGARKYDVKAAVDMLKKNKLLAPSLPTGSPRPRKARDANIPQLNKI